MQSRDWKTRCEQALRSFDLRIAEAVDKEQLAELPKGCGYFAENRRGEMVFYGLPSLSIGAVHVGADAFESHREISAAAAEAKKNAKKTSGSSLFVERRQVPPESSPQAGQSVLLHAACGLLRLPGLLR